MSTTTYQVAGLGVKISKHLATGNTDKAAFYHVARLQRDGRPEPGSVEDKEHQALREAGYRFFGIPPNEAVFCIFPDGSRQDGPVVLASWNDLFKEEL